MSTPETVTTEAPEPVQKKPGVIYDLLPAGAITRHDTKIEGSKAVAIAHLANGKVSFTHKDFEKYTVQIRGLLVHKGVQAEIVPYMERPPVMRDAVLVSDTGEDRPQTSSIGSAAAIVTPVDPDGPDGMRTLTVDQRKAVNLLRSKEGFPLGELERPAPPVPAGTSGAGDKHPPVVAHYLRYDPKEFCRRYGVQKVGSIEITVPGQLDPISHTKKPATRRWEAGHVLARRGTVFTKVLRTLKPDEKEESL